MEICFTIEGRPRGKDRPRFRKIGKFVSTYNTKGTKDYEEKVEDSYNKFYKDNPFLEGALEADIKSYFAPPSSISKKKQSELLGKPYTKKPDSDNIGKIVLDPLNNLAFKDDSQVSDLIVRKAYSSRERTEVRIKELDNIIRPAIYYL